MLSSVNLRTLRGLLDDREQELNAMIEANSDRDVDSLPNILDRKDLADKIATNEVRDAEAGRAREKLRQVVAARERLESGTYGRCVDCEADIDLGRLMLEPATSRPRYEPLGGAPFIDRASARRASAPSRACPPPV